MVIVGGREAAWAEGGLRQSAWLRHARPHRLRCICHFARMLSASSGVRWARSRRASSASSGSGRAGAKSPSCAASLASVRSCPASSARSEAPWPARSPRRAGREPRDLDAVAPVGATRAPPCAGTRSHRSTRGPPRGSCARRRAARRAAVSSWKWVANSTFAPCPRSWRASTTAQAMARPSKVDVPRPTSSRSTRLRGVTLCRIAGGLDHLHEEGALARARGCPARRRA